MRHIQRDWVCCLLLAENISVQTRDTASETASARAQHAWCGGSAPFSSRCGVALRTVPRPPPRAHCRVPAARAGAFAHSPSYRLRAHCRPTRRARSPRPWHSCDPWQARGSLQSRRRHSRPRRSVFAAGSRYACGSTWRKPLDRAAHPWRCAGPARPRQPRLSPACHVMPAW